ncbi:hypothetical protein [Aquimarina sp. 2201CG5-10]|uniref:hypothetical protein n=1 Tax=Aquimarina callyspongiae TaxID=3098150 RepID=UPI002AB3B536|nr:hypothetical protein [Aquimarina sp. 2201CG5-10]MDY8138636.1 hypothetical protein [Aquimarina sp. 2201CG5-10]
MALISSGSYNGDLNNHLIFINMMYGSLLNALYYIWPSIEWYTLIFIVINIISTALIGLNIIRFSKNYVVKATFLTFLFFVFVEILVNLQFTKTAAIAAISGVLTIYNFNNSQKYWGVLLFVLAALIRFEAAFLVLIVIGPVFFLDYFNSPRKFSLTVRIKTLILSISIAFACKFIDYTYYQFHDDWKHYSEYNSLRGKINDNPNARMVFYNLPKGVSRLDYESLLTFFANPAVMNYDSLQDIYEVIEEIPSLTKIRYIYGLHYYITPLFLLLVILLSCRYTKEKKASINIVVVVIIGIMIGVLSFLSFNAIVKYRVFFSVLVPFVFILSTLLRDFKWSNQKRVMFLSVFLLAMYIGNVTYSSYKTKRHYDYVYADQSNMINKYIKEKNNKVIVYSGDYKVEYQNPFQLSLNHNIDKLYFGGWLTNIPFHKNKFDSFKYLIDGYGLLVLKNRYNQALTQVSNSVFLETNVEIHPKIVAESESSFIVEFNQIKN